jgi:hypothetical protein
MSLVFISHAHSDEALAQKLAALLGDALGLSPTDFFLSSQAGRGVAPSASISLSIETELATARAQVVLLTPHAVTRPWVWLEAGSRLGAGKTAPIFLVLDDRCAPILGPLSDSRYLRLSKDGELIELVKAVSKDLDKPPLDVLTYKPALDDLVRSGRRAATSARVASWFSGPLVGMIALVVGALMLGSGAWLTLRRPAPSPPIVATDNDADRMLLVNDAVAKAASKFLVLKGVVTAEGQGVDGATVMVTHQGDQPPAKSSCQEPDCTSSATRSDGNFKIDLTKIKANSGDDIVMWVTGPPDRNFKPYSKDITVDVRAMEAGTTPQNVVLVPLK